MVTALRPLQPSATSLLRRSLLLRPTRCHLPICHKVNHGSSTHRIERHTAHAYAANRAGASNETENVLGLARRALKQTIAPHSVVDISGHGHHMGMDVVWQYKLRPDGAFLESISGKELKFRWGCHGGADANCWEVDDTDVPKPLQLDDNEACLVAAWVKSGLWLSPDVSGILDIHVVLKQADELQGTDLPEAADAERPADSLHNPPGGPSTSHTPATPDPPSDPAPTRATPTQAVGGTSPNSSTAQQKGVNALQESTSASSASTANTGNKSSNSSSSSLTDIEWDSAADTDTSSVDSQEDCGMDSPGTEDIAAAQSQPYVVLAVKLKSGRLVSQVRLCRESWQPVALLQAVCGEVLTWHYQEWQEWQPNFCFPTEHIHLTPSGGNNTFTATSASTSLAPKLSDFVMPEPPLTPQDTTFNPQLPATVPAWHTRSGHVLVQPKLNGQDVGYMMLDTGASGLVIEQGTADELGLAAFGEMYVAGMGGRLLCQFRRGQQLTVGPVTIQRPLFMQMSLSGVVAGAPGPVTGILGYDIFRRCVMELPPSSHDSSNAPFNLTLHDPSTYTLTPRLDYRWQPLVMIANLPHVEVLLTIKEGDKPVKCMFMLDSGAGGVDAMFHSRAVRELGLIQDNKHGMRTLTGVGGSAVGGMRVKSGEISSIDLSSHQFHEIKCLFTDSDGLDHTLYSSGILCGDIMSRCTVIFDYARARIMFVPDDAAGSDRY